MSEKGFRVEIPVKIKRDRRARKVLAQDDSSTGEESAPRIARLLALAWKWEGMVRRGEASGAVIAHRHGLSSARIAQICALTLLSPAIQEEVLMGRSEATQLVEAGTRQWYAQSSSPCSR